MNNLKERIHENGIDYVLCGDYYIPEIQIPRQDRPIGHYGRLRRVYLREFRPVLYQGYISQGKLFEHLANVNTQAQERMDVMLSSDCSSFRKSSIVACRVALSLMAVVTSSKRAFALPKRSVRPS